MRTSQIDALCASTFAGAPVRLQAHLSAQMRANARFAAFVDANQDKMRKKLRGQRDEPGQCDVAFEVMVADRLLADPGCALAYEAFSASKTRGPDFTATYKGHLVVHVEVRRLRGAVAPTRIGDALAEKLRQLVPGAPNVVVLGAEGALETLAAPGAAATAMRTRAEAHDGAFFARHGFTDAPAFFRAFLRLSAVALLAPWDYGVASLEASAGAPVEASAGAAADRAPVSALWLNPQAKHPLPPAVRSALRTL